MLLLLLPCCHWLPMTSFLLISLRRLSVRHFHKRLPRASSTPLSLRGKPSPTAFLNKLCRSGDVDAAEAILAWILRSGLEVGAFVYTSMMLGHCRRRDLPAAFAVFRRMEAEEGQPPGSAAYTTLINGLCVERRVDEALALLREMSDRGVAPTVRTYTSLIGVLCDSGRTGEACALVRDMRKRGCSPNVHTYTALISGMCSSGALEIAVALFNGMEREGIAPNVVTYNALIHGLLSRRRGGIDCALRLLAEMRRSGCVPNTRTYNEILKGICSIGELQQAMALLHGMLQVGPSPDRVTYNTLVGGFCKIGKVNNAIRVAELMRGEGMSPDEFTYTELISGLCKNGKVSLAYELFEEMVGCGLHPNVVAYTAVIDGYCREGQLDRAVSLMERMEGNGCYPTLQTYNALMSGFARANNQLQGLRTTFGRILRQGLRPNVVTYTTLVDGLCKNGATSAAFEVVDEMRRNECSPNLLTYSALIHGLCLEGRVEEGEHMVMNIREKGFDPDQVTYNLVIDAYVAFNKVGSAFALTRQMIKSRCQPNFRTYSILMKGLKNCRQPSEREVAAALSSNHYGLDDITMDFNVLSDLMARLTEDGIGSEIDVYSTLLDGMCNGGKWLAAQQLFKVAIDKDLCLSQDAYDSLLTAASKYPDVDSALEILKLMSARGFRPPLSGYRALICALCQTGRREKAQDVFEGMLSWFWNPDEIVWTVLIDGLLRLGQLDMCRELLRLMEAKNLRPSLQTYVILSRETSKEEEKKGMVMDPPSERL